MKTSTLHVPKDLHGQRLDMVVLRLLGDDFSRAQVQRLLKGGNITLQGEPGRPSQKVASGQRIDVEIPEPTPVDLVPTPMDLQILFEDEHLVIVNKAPGVVVHPSAGHDANTLVHGLLHHCGPLAAVGGKQRPGIVHRLDKDTSGAMVVAKDDQTHRALVAMFASGRVAKQYLALVHGTPPWQGEIKTGIGRHPVDRKRMSGKAKNTKAAHTAWRVTRRFHSSGMSLLRVRIYTGRTHQIRVHLSEEGFPVVGDGMYGGRRERKAIPGVLGQCLKTAGRQMLHSTELAFEHPLSGLPVAVTAPLPGDFRAVLRALEAAEK